DWSSDVCSSDLQFGNALALQLPQRQQHATLERRGAVAAKIVAVAQVDRLDQQLELDLLASIGHIKATPSSAARPGSTRTGDPARWVWPGNRWRRRAGSAPGRSSSPWRSPR